MRPRANVFLLTHKCGNNYVESVFAGDSTFLQFQSDDIRGEMPGPFIGMAPLMQGDFVNIRCRNFDPISIARLLHRIDAKKSRFFLFTRHPGSFFRSAAAYHLRGGEEWARTNRYSYLNNCTLHDALVSAAHNDERLIICMKHFGLTWRLLDRWIQNYRFLLSIDAELFVVKTEEVFFDASREYFDDLASRLTHGSYAISPERLMSCSPVFMEHLPSHSTGEFRKSFFDGYGKRSIRFYNENFLGVQNYFYD